MRSTSLLPSFSFFPTLFLPLFPFHILHSPPHIQLTLFSLLESMEVTESNCSSAYGKPPWIFKGSALYQLHLVKAETARAFIPKEFRLVEAFGYTLGGFFLANYNDSPAGGFDELVVIAGIVWNPPTSCAWASRVLVSSKDACAHGRKDVGLPSQVAKFSKRIDEIPKQRQSRFSAFFNKSALSNTPSSGKHKMDVEVAEIDGPSMTDICTISTIGFDVVPDVKVENWRKGPTIKMSLPSFSGRTKYNPNLLKYSCKIECRLRAVEPAQVFGPSVRPGDSIDESVGHNDCKEVDSIAKYLNDNQRNLNISVLLSKPILALQFSCLRMQVEAPVEVPQPSQNSYAPSFRVS